MTTHVFLVSIHHYKPCHMHSHIFVFHLCRTNELDVWCFKYYHNMFINDLTTTMVVQLHHNTCLLGVHPSLQTLPYALTYLSFPIMSHWRARLLVLEIVSQNVHFEVRSYPPKKTGAGIGLLTETGALLKRQLRGTWAMRERERERLYMCGARTGTIARWHVSSHPYLVPKGQKALTQSINPMLAWISSHSCSTSLSSSHHQMLCNLDLVHAILLPKCLYGQPQKERKEERKKEGERERDREQPPQPAFPDSHASTEMCSQVFT